jgi:hypothetical protein
MYSKVLLGGYFFCYVVALISHFSSIALLMNRYYLGAKRHNRHCSIISPSALLHNYFESPSVVVIRQ